MKNVHNQVELDRPDLNKCPDCGCFFAQDTCPLCGKLCPEEMRAGRRKKEKNPKLPPSASSTERVTFMSWYHQWWFIILMWFVSPIIGLVLFATSPRKPVLKRTVTVIVLLLMFLSAFGIPWLMYEFVQETFYPLVDTSMGREEYMASCHVIAPEEYYREAGRYEDAFVTMTLTVSERVVDAGTYYSSDYSTYYVCHSEGNPDIVVLIRDCVQEDPGNFLAGDVITVYGEGAGEYSFYDMHGNAHAGACLNAAYIVLNP